MNKAISFSLYGNNPKYIEGLFDNLDNYLHIYYPGFDVLVYVDDSISNSLEDELKMHGAHVIRPTLKVPPMYLRLLAMSNYYYDYILYRDADSRFNAREAAAVNDWIDSCKPLHVMRDHPNHHTPIMGGMFGTFDCHDVNIEKLLAEYAPLTFTYGDDERFLAERVWPLLQDDVFINDSNGTYPFHVSNADGMHVGQQIEWPVRRAVVISTTDDDDYFLNAPYCAAYWHRFGWDVILLHRGKRKINFDIDVYVNIKGDSALSDASIAQLSRLFAAPFAMQYDMLMTADVDMIPLSDTWKPGHREITVYGKDLTGDKQQCPLCYIAMHPQRWAALTLPSGHLVKDAEAAYDGHIESWFADQEYITKLLNEEEVIYIDRGFVGNTNLALGRMDRADWGAQCENPIDAHMPRPFNNNNFDCLPQT